MRVRNIVSWILLAVAFFILIDATIIYRFSHPTLTETQLFLQVWPSLVVSTILCIVAVVIENVG